MSVRPSPVEPTPATPKSGTPAGVGYKVHLTKTCEADRPNLITDVQTTAVGMPDGAMTAPVHSALAARGLLPDVVDAALLVASQVDQAVDLLGSV